MEGKRVIQSLSVKNILSYGSEGVTLELQPLNILIGPNGSGKSNFLEVLRLLSAAPRSLAGTSTARGEGVDTWFFKGANSPLRAELSVSVYSSRGNVLTHRLEIGEAGGKFSVIVETIDLQISDLALTMPLYIYSANRRQAEIASQIYMADSSLSTYSPLKPIKIETLVSTQSILAQRTEPETYPDLYSLARTYGSIQLYTEVIFGRDTPARQSQKADLDSTYLFEDGSNLALVINDLQNRPGVMRGIIARLRKFNPRVQDIITRVSYGTVQLYIEEEGLQQTLPATRLSDGTLRYLFLLVLLCHPEPPPIICIEEPELGLHPDMIRSVAEMLIEASQRTQIIVTTHSDLLVSALSEVPEAIVVCEHDGESSALRRLQPDKLNLWLEKYSLGELWLKGEIGGTRW